MTIKLILGRDGFGEGTTEEDFEDWVAFVAERVGAACGFPVEVDERGRRDVQTDDVRGGDDAQYEDVFEAKEALWDEWCTRWVGITVVASNPRPTETGADGGVDVDVVVTVRGDGDVRDQRGRPVYEAWGDPSMWLWLDGKTLESLYALDASVLRDALEKIEAEAARVAGTPPGRS